LNFRTGSLFSWQIIREEGRNMSAPVTIEELCELEEWAASQDENIRQIAKAVDAFVALRDLMTLELSQKNLLKYLHQEMGIVPKSERGNNSLAKQPGESVPRAILRQP
jgi:hypothetical protein